MRKYVRIMFLLFSGFATIGVPVWMLIQELVGIPTSKRIPVLPIIFISVIIICAVRIKIMENAKHRDNQNLQRIIRGEDVVRFMGAYEKVYLYPLIGVLVLYGLIFAIDTWAVNMLAELQIYLGLFIAGYTSYKISKVVK